MRRRFVVVLVILAVLVLAVAGVGVWVAVTTGPTEAMAEYVAELRARGEPVTFEDLEPPMPPEAENGAFAWDLALAWVDTHLDAVDAGQDERWYERFAGPWDLDGESPWYAHTSDEQLDDLRGFLSSFGPFLDRVEEATSMPELAWPVESAEMRMSSFGAYDSLGFTRARRLLEAHAIAASDVLERHRALKCLIALDRRMRLRLSIDHLVEAVRRRLDCTLLRDGVESGLFDPAEVRPTCERLFRGGSVARMPLLLRLDRLGEIEYYPSHLDGSVNAAPRELQRLWGGGGKETDWERARHSVEDRLAGLRFDWRAYLARLRARDEVIPQDDVWDDAAERRLAAFCTAWEEPYSQRLLQALRGADAADALARVALAACLHRTTHGDWPASADDLAPLFPDGVPVDPYAGGPFTLERDGDALVLRAHPPADEPPAPAETPRDAGLEWRLPPR